MPCLEPAHCGDDQASGNWRTSDKETMLIIPGINRHDLLRNEVACIDPFIHVVQTHPRDRFVILQHPAKGPQTAITRQKRWMHIDAAERRQLDDRRPEKLGETRAHDDIRPEDAQAREVGRGIDTRHSVMRYASMVRQQAAHGWCLCPTACDIPAKVRTSTPDALGTLEQPVQETMTAESSRDTPPPRPERPFADAHGQLAAPGLQQCLQANGAEPASIVSQKEDSHEAVL